MSKKTGTRRPKDELPPNTRACRRCSHTKPLSLFARAGKGKHSNLCRECDNARQRARWAADPEAARAKSRAKRQRKIEQYRARELARYWRNPEESRAQRREQARSERGRASNRKAVARYRRAHPEVIAAQHAAQKALHRGELRVSLVCEIKGCRETESLHLHHVRYDKPREVIRACGRARS